MGHKSQKTNSTIILTKTSGAKARIKLHSQVHFGLKKDFGQKFLVKKIEGPKDCMPKKLRVKKKFQLQKICVQKNLAGKQILVLRQRKF